MGKLYINSQGDSKEVVPVTEQDGYAVHDLGVLPESVHAAYIQKMGLTIAQGCKWHELQMSGKMTITRPIQAKFNMMQRVMDDIGAVFDYAIVDGKVDYTFYAFMQPVTPSDNG